MLDTTRSVIWKTVIWANLFPLQFTRTAGFILYVVREKWKKKVESKKQRKIIWVKKSEGGGDSRRLMRGILIGENKTDLRLIASVLSRTRRNGPRW